MTEAGIAELFDQVYATGEAMHGHEYQVWLDRSGSGRLSEAYFNFTIQLMYEGDAKAGVAIFAFEVTEQVHACLPGRNPAAL